jgi:GNAT superfamily N-acetyltransferase
VSELDRARGFVLANDEAGADRVEPWERGVALLTPTTARLWDANYLRVDRPAGLDAPALAAEADRILGAGGARHRAVVVPDGQVAEPLRPGFSRLGWECDRLLFMVLEGTPHQRPGAPAVDAITREDAMALQRELFTAEPEPSGGSEVADEVAIRDERIVSFREVRRFGARLDGRLVAACSLLLGDGVAEVDNVNTLPSHRGRGLARAAVVAAARAARDSGVEMVFLGAYRDDWPHRWYRRLGFVEVGTLLRFRRI